VTPIRAPVPTGREFLAHIAKNSHLRGLTGLWVSDEGARLGSGLTGLRPPAPGSSEKAQ